VTKNQLLAVLAAIVVAVVGLGAYIMLGNGSGTGDGTSAGYAVLPTDRSLGNKDAKLVLIEYAAPTCPHCAAFSENIFPAIREKYIDTGKIHFVFRVYPLHPEDGAVEKIARCLPEDKYQSFIDLAFRNQPLWNPGNGVTDVHGGLVRIGRMAGLSAEQVDKCIENSAEDDRINAVSSEAERRYGVNSTPTLILNGTNIGIGGGSIAELSKLIDAELAK
jgi:protein-disulfide isomerase